MSNIVLIGHIGAGKSTIGQCLREKLNAEYVDTDQHIEAIHSKTLCELVNELGELAFRKIESEVIEKLANNKDAVISTGGGAVLNPVNRTLLSQMGMVVFLDVDHEEQLSRLEFCTKRPLLLTGDRSEILQQMRHARQSIYEDMADITINTTQKSSQDVTMEIIASLA